MKTTINEMCDYIKDHCPEGYTFDICNKTETTIVILFYYTIPIANYSVGGLRLATEKIYNYYKSINERNSIDNTPLTC